MFRREESNDERCVEDEPGLKHIRKSRSHLPRPLTLYISFFFRRCARFCCFFYKRCLQLVFLQFSPNFARLISQWNFTISGYVSLKFHIHPIFFSINYHFFFNSSESHSSIFRCPIENVDRKPSQAKCGISLRNSFIATWKIENSSLHSVCSRVTIRHSDRTKRSLNQSIPRVEDGVSCQSYYWTTWEPKPITWIIKVSGIKFEINIAWRKKISIFYTRLKNTHQ